MRAGAEPAIRIVVGVDGSDRSARALAWALGVARRVSGRLIAVHVLQEPRAATVVPELVQATRDAQRAVADDLREAVCQELRAAGVPGHYETAVGDPVGAIERLVDEARADLIVVGTPTRSHLRSTAVRLVRHAHCPTVVVP